MSPGSTYNAETAVVIDQTSPGTLSLSNVTGLTTAGATASFKLFVKLATGNEAGSNTITITRPA